MQKPELLAVEASVAHSSRKLNNAQKLQEQVSKDVDRQATKLRGYRGDLETVQRAANEAQGERQTQFTHRSS
jgi:structural maintenance of chromosome 1